MNAASNPPIDLVVETNRELLLSRSQVGLAKYGTSLYNGNYTEEQILQHALEEALDLANYLQTRLMRIRGQLPPLPTPLGPVPSIEGVYG